MRFEVARLFNVMPFDLKFLPVTEYRRMQHYYLKYRETLEAGGSQSSEPTDGVIIE